MERLFCSSDVFTLLQTYEGDFFRDRRHGRGVYTWSDGSSYEGFFYLDQKEGYGTFTSSNSTKFEVMRIKRRNILSSELVSHWYSGRNLNREKDPFCCERISFHFVRLQGLYKSDEREGPGVLSYPDGREDVGLWHREKLVKLCSSIPEAFTVKTHKDLDFNPDDAKLYIEPQEVQNQTDILEDILSPPPEFDYPPPVDILHRTKILFGEGLHANSAALDIKSFDNSYFGRNSAFSSEHCIVDNSKKEKQKSAPKMKHDNGRTSPGGRILAWNNTPSSIAMQLHVEKHKDRQHSTSFSVDAILGAKRKGFGPKGPLELASEDFLQTAMSGDVQKLKNILNEGLVNVDVADESGHTALLGASVSTVSHVISLLRILQFQIFLVS